MKLFTTETNRIGSILILLLALPLSLEINKIFELWLKKPPQFSQDMCLFIIASLVVDKTTGGHMIAVIATGRIALFQLISGLLLIIALPLAYILLKHDFGVMSIGYAILITTSFSAWGRVFFAHKILDMSAKQWLKKVLAPVIFLSVISETIGYTPHLFMDESVVRIILTTIISETALITLSWFIVLDENEKWLIKNKCIIYLNNIIDFSKKKSKRISYN